jgi:hypothetical protein
MVFVEDVVNAISLSVTRLNSKTYGWLPSKGKVEVFNVGTGSQTSAVNLIRKTLWLTNSSSPLRVIPADDRFPSQYVGSTVKATSVLGYKSQVTIDEGLHRLATEFLEDTVSYLAQKRASAPFHCEDTNRNYGLDTLLAMDGCSGMLSLNVDGEAYYATTNPADKEGRWNKTVKFQSHIIPSTFKLNIRKSDGGDAAIVGFEEGGKNWEFTFDKPPESPDTEFLARMDRRTGYVSLTKLNGQPLVKRAAPSAAELGDLASEYEEEPADLLAYPWRITPVCCPKKPAPWPLFKEDSLAANILDSRTGVKLAFEASQMSTMCNRLKQARHHAALQLERLESIPRPIFLEEAELPNGRAHEWRQRRNTEYCSILCDHPTFCVDTGDCACGHAAQCEPRRRFPFSDVANLPTLSYPVPKQENLGDKALVERVARSSWLNMLNSDARRYFGDSPKWPAVTSVRDPDDVETIKKNNATQFWTLRNSGMGCFSADTVMERASQLISTPFKADSSLVFLPFYSINDLVKVSAYPPVLANHPSTPSLSHGSTTPPRSSPSRRRSTRPTGS